MDGRSLLPILRNTTGEVYRDNDAVGIELGGNSFLLRGDYKLTRNSFPRGDGQWRLHNVRLDPAEVDDLSEEFPALRDELLEEYERYASRNNVMPLPVDFDIVAQVNQNIAESVVRRNALPLLVSVAILASGVFLLVRLLRRRRATSARR
ncbi:unnamed protein product [Ectocarpus sp. 12 AP-2014]